MPRWIEVYSFKCSSWRHSKDRISGENLKLFHDEVEKNKQNFRPFPMSFWGVEGKRKLFQFIFTTNYISKFFIASHSFICVVWLSNWHFQRFWAQLLCVYYVVEVTYYGFLSLQNSFLLLLLLIYHTWQSFWKLDYSYSLLLLFEVVFWCIILD